MARPIPEIESQILAFLTRDASISNSLLAETLSISRPTLINHLKKLGGYEKSRDHSSRPKPISHYSAVIDMLKLNARLFFIEIKTNPEEPRIIAELREIPQVLSIDGIIGEFSLWVKVIVKDQAEFARVLNEIDRILGETLFQRYRVIEVLIPFKEFGEKYQTTSPTTEGLDNTKWQILGKLRRLETRKFAREIHRRLIKTPSFPGAALSTIGSKLKELTEDGFIRRFTVSVIPEFAREGTKFLLRVKPKNLAHYDALAKLIVDKPNITCLYRTGEDYGLLAIVRVRDISSYRQFITELYRTGEVLDTHTTLVIEEVEAAIVPFTVGDSDQK